jgi:hypothetical protein
LGGVKNFRGRWRVKKAPPFNKGFSLFVPPKREGGGGGGVADSTVVRKWKWFFVIAMQNPNLYRNGTFKLVPILDQCINVLGDYVDKYSGSLSNAGNKIALCNF